MAKYNNKNKKLFHAISSTVLVLLAAWSIYKIIELIQKYDLISVFSGFGMLASSGNDIVDISGYGAKFIGYNTPQTVDAFSDFLSLEGYTKIGKFGKSDLYEYNGEEIIIKRSKLFNKYYLFEIFNDEYLSRMPK